MEYRLLGQTGLKVSVLSFGASSLGSVFRATDDREAIRTVHIALDLGVNFIDVAPLYGAAKAETVLGRALGDIRRDRYYLATKVGQYADGSFDFSADRVTRSLDESCVRLGVDYVDLLQCHDIEFADLNQIVDETLPALARLKQAGRIGHIGITGLPLKIFPAVLERAAPGLVETVLSFCHYELNDTSLESLLPGLRQRNIGVINAAPTGMGLLTPQGTPAWHPAPPAIIAGCRRAADYCQSIGADIVKLALQFSVGQPLIATTVLGTANPENMRCNVAYAESPPDPVLLARVREILRPIHNHNFTRGRLENRDPVLA
ncbi:MAG: aldo/keto reductase [Opitutales bacterium]